MKKRIIISVLSAFVLVLSVSLAARSETTAATAKKLYIDYINENPGSEPDISRYSLVYINDDDVPELLIDFGFSFEGNHLCTVADGDLEVVSFSQGGLLYFERKNLFVLSGGRMDNFYDNVYRIQNGRFVRLHNGEYGAEDNANVQLDAEGDPIYRYYWDGKEVSKRDYERLLNSVFDVANATDPYVNGYSAREIISKILDL